MSRKNSSKFNPDCRDCPRLAGFLDQVALKHPDYHARPVAPFGDDDARLLIVGLAPGVRGANRTGRPFTGDYAGDLLYPTIARFGFGDGKFDARPDDGFKMIDCRITNAVRCVPPENKPTTDEIKACNPFLKAEIESLAGLRAILALGLIAHKAVLRSMGLIAARYKFGHGAMHELPNGLLMANSYHCSRYNTNTGRLTEEMFHAVFAELRDRLA